MKSSRLVTYRGNLLEARLNYKREQKRALRKWKRELLKVWDLNRVTLWNGGYVNDDVRKALGLEENFLTSTDGLENFGVELKPDINADAVIDLSEDNKEYLRDKCLSIFTEYGKTIKVAYYDSKSYDYKIFKDGVETDFTDAENEDLATLLYSRLVMYMVDNDSTDTLDTWADVNPGDFDYWTSFERTKEVTVSNDDGNYTYTISEDARSQLKYFTYTFTNEDILKVINDRLFTKRRYKVKHGISGYSNGDNDGASDRKARADVYAYTIDRDLLNELLDNSDYESQVFNETTLTTWNSTTQKYEIDLEAVKELPPKEFMMFIQTHLGTFYNVKKKWYQSGLFGFIVVVIAVVIAIYAPYLLDKYFAIAVGLGTTLVVAGMVLSISGALLGNKVMMMGGQIVSLAGAGINIAEAYALEEAAIQEATRELARSGAEQSVINATISQMQETLITNTLLSVGKLGLSAYSSFASIGSDTVIEKSKTPEEELNILYIAEDEQWDFFNRMTPEYIIASTMKMM